ncbi:MAG: hypothetical protein ACUZ8E_13680 [Candidatus Anammoxibacter sp.]
MDDDISNINNITRFRPYDGKNEPQRKRKKKKKADDQVVQDEEEQDEYGVANGNMKDGEDGDSVSDSTGDSKGDSEGDEVGHNIDVDI